MVDTDFTRKEFVQLLRELTSSKDSIQKATKMMVEHVDHSDELFGALMKRLKKTAAKRRLPLFYLLDSVCQVTKNKSQKEYRELVAKHLNEIVTLIVPEEGEGRDKAFSVVIKVLGLWKERKVFGSDCIKRAKRKIEGPERNSSKERQSVCVGMDIDVVQKRMEEDRRENKRSRWEDALRPANDPPGAEFDDMWDKFIKEEDWKMSYPHLSYKNPHVRDPVRGRSLNKPLSSSAPAMSSLSPNSNNIRYNLSSSPRDGPPSSSTPSSTFTSPPSPSSTPLYIQTPSDVNMNPPIHDYMYYRMNNDNRAFPEYGDHGFMPNRELQENRESLEPRERELLERELYEREMRDRDLSMPPPPPPNYDPGYPPPPPPGYPNMPPPPPHMGMPPPRYDYERDPRYDYGDPPYRDRDMRGDYREGNLRSSGGRDMREIREFRDIRDLRDLRDVRELRELSFREGNPNYPPPAPPSPRSYSNQGYANAPPPMGYGMYGMDNPGGMPYGNNIYRSGGGGGFYTPSASPQSPRSPYSPSSPIYVHHPHTHPPPPPPPRQGYDHRPSARPHRYPNRV